MSQRESYESADLELHLPHSEDEPCPGSRWHDDRGKTFVFLPHSCDEWIIGGPQEIKLLISDLQEALKRMEATP